MQKKNKILFVLLMLPQLTFAQKQVMATKWTVADSITTITVCDSMVPCVLKITEGDSELKEVPGYTQTCYVTIYHNNLYEDSLGKRYILGWADAWREGEPKRVIKKYYDRSKQPFSNNTKIWGLGIQL